MNAVVVHSTEGDLQALSRELMASAMIAAVPQIGASSFSIATNPVS